jgi:hypothetical protein
MSDFKLNIGADISNLNKGLQEAAAELNKLRGTADITGKNLKDSLELASAAQRRFRETISMNNAALLKTRVGMSGLKDEIAAYTRANSKLEVNMRDLASEYEKLTKRRQQGANALSQEEGNLLALLTRYNRLASTQSQLSAQTANYRNNLAAVTTAANRLRQANGELGASQGQLGMAFKSTLGFANKLAGVFGFGLGLYGLMRVFKVSTDAIVKFDDKIRGLAAISGATARQMEDLSRQAIKLGSASKYGAAGVAEMMTQLAKMGFNVEEINRMSAGITKLATAAHEELEPTAETVANIIRAMGMEAQDTGRIVDTMALAFTRSALDLRPLQGIYKICRAAGKAG